MRVATALRTQAASCRALGSPMYGDILDHLADDASAGGATWDLLAAHDDDPGPSALGLRLLGSVHRLVLSGQAPELVGFYPSAGGRWEPRAGCAAVLRYVSEHPERVQEWLDRPPQTNEVGRAAALMGGLLHLASMPGAMHPLPVRLREIGASGGLNLRVDRYAYLDDRGNTFGRAGSPLVISGAWTGHPPAPGPEPVVLDRVGCDTRPVDATTPEGRLTLTAYTWPDQGGRLERLRAALDIAASVPVELRQQDAVTFARELDLQEGTVTVLWHSIVWQYLAHEEQRAVIEALERLGRTATPTRRLAKLCLEPTRRSVGTEHELLVVLRTWPHDGNHRNGEHGGRMVLGRAEPHGPPVTWDRQA